MSLPKNGLNVDKVSIKYSVVYRFQNLHGMFEAHVALCQCCSVVLKK